MGNCIGIIQCYRLMKCLDDCDEEENLHTQLINSPQKNIEKQRKLFGLKNPNKKFENIEVL